MTIEATITKRQITYISAMGYDIHRHQFILLCTHEPHLNTITRSVIFRGVTQYQDVWDDPEAWGNNDLDSIIGIHAYPEAMQTRYVVRTESREVTFVSALMPDIIEHVSG